MSLVKAVRIRSKRLTRPAPMKDFADYDAYWKERGSLDNITQRWITAADAIPDGAKVLDVGCGSGQFLTYLRQRRPNINPVGTDFSEVAVSKAKDNGFEAFTLDLSAQDLPDKYDYITCFEVLEHIPNAEDALRRLMDAATAQVIVSVPNVGYIDNRLRLMFFGRFPVTNCIFHIKEHVRHWTRKDFVEWTSRLGYKVVAVSGQYGNRRLGKKYPGLFSSGLVYVIERA